ncbi:MAG: M43 family zinc metalloprotease [Saprospiraceae bacterium]|nr:M43 family zinc metalloprotease [Saprospiraceae bacterium]
MRLLAVSGILLSCLVFLAPVQHDVPSIVANTSPPDTVYTLPVVIHVIHTGSPVGAPDNPSDSLICAMLASLNDSWRKDGPPYGGVDMEIQVALAVRSPGCDTTSGINRIDGTVFTDYATGGITNIGTPGSVDEILVKGLSRWPNTDYINIWIVNKINGSSTSPGGYAYFPEFNNALTDGIVVLASVVNGENKTVVHEMGHYFYLYHPYEGSLGMTCAPDTNCAVDGDLVCDTEVSVFLLDCATDTNVCSGMPFAVADTALGYTVLNNYMGFTDCPYMFTQGQKTRARDALCSFRPGLINSGAFSPPDSTPVPACTPTATNGLSPYYGIQLVEFGPLAVYSNTSEGDAAFYVDRTCNQRVEVSAGDTCLLRITGSYLNWQQIKVFLDYDGDGQFAVPGEVLLDTSGSIVEDSITIPLDTILFEAPLRLRVVTELPAGPSPDPCHLTGIPADGVGQIEDVTVVVWRREVHSVASGPWDVPGTWDCNCVPGPADLITVRSGDTVTVPALLDSVVCAALTVAPGAAVINGSTVFVSR